MLLSWVLRSCLFVCVSLPSVLSHMSLSDWHCGSEDTSKNISYDTVHEECPLVAFGLNHCCVIHDDCYSRQTGQEQCDADFCLCSERIANTSAGAGCRTHTDLVCWAMPFMGIAAYKSSANYTDPDDSPKYLPSWHYLRDSYAALYGTCQTINGTLSSCAMQFNHCSLGNSTCAEQLCSCMNDAYLLDSMAECGSATAALCMAAVRDSSLSWFERVMIKPYPISDNVVAMLAASGAILVMFCLFKLYLLIYQIKNIRTQIA